MMWLQLETVGNMPIGCWSCTFHAESDEGFRLSCDDVMWSMGPSIDIMMTWYNVISYDVTWRHDKSIMSFSFLERQRGGGSQSIMEYDTVWCHVISMWNIIGLDTPAIIAGGFNAMMWTLIDIICRMWCWGNSRSEFLRHQQWYHKWHACEACIQHNDWSESGNSLASRVGSGNSLCEFSTSEDTKEDMIVTSAI
jgi:hypothetical protein